MKHTIFCDFKDCEARTEMEIFEGIEPRWLCPLHDGLEDKYNLKDENLKIEK